MPTATTATEGYDKFYDLPKPYQKPFDNQVNLSIEQVYLGVPITSYQQMLIDNFKTQEADSYTWNLKLKTTLLESVTISSETSNQFPDGYHVKIINGIMLYRGKCSI